jgi:hypothetical protein
VFQKCTPQRKIFKTKVTKLHYTNSWPSKQSCLTADQNETSRTFSRTCFPIFPQNVQKILRPTQCVSEISRPEREANHSPPANAPVKNEWRYASTSTCHQLVHRDNLTLTLRLPSYSVSHLCVIKHTTLNIKGECVYKTTKFQTRYWMDMGI